MDVSELEIKREKQFKSLKNLIWATFTVVFAILALSNSLSLYLTNVQIYQLICLLSGIVTLGLAILVSYTGMSVMNAGVGSYSVSGSSERDSTQGKKRAHFSSSGYIILLLIILAPAVLLLFCGILLKPTDITFLVFVVLTLVSVVTGQKITNLAIEKLFLL
ncbi:MAG: hypothetical protein ACFFD4_37005 [Candidatus Odinarchaeota archaeon]